MPVQSVIYIGFVCFCCAHAALAQHQRLGYPHDRVLKDAVFHLNEVEGLAAAIEERLAGMREGDPTVQIRDVETLQSTVDRCRRSLSNASENLQNLPSDHPDVQAQRKRYDQMTQRVNLQQEKVKALQESLENIVGQVGTTEWEVDFERLREINQMFANPEWIESQPQRAAEIIRQIGPARQERQRIADKYAALLQQNTPQSRDMNGVLKFFDEQFGRYDAAVKGYAAEAPGRVQSHVEEALKMAGDAIADRNHLYFKEDGGVAQRLGWAQTRVDLLAAIDPDSAETRQARQLLENARQQVAQLKSQLTDDIIAANRPLDDRYQGPDRGQILALIQEKWEKEGNGAQVLKVAVNGDQWQRTTRWDWSSANKAWQKVDYSSLQGYLIVKDTDTQAVAHYINVKRDHLANDRLTAWFLSDPRETPDLGNRFLIENLK